MGGGGRRREEERGGARSEEERGGARSRCSTCGRLEVSVDILERSVDILRENVEKAFAGVLIVGFRGQELTAQQSAKCGGNDLQTALASPLAKPKSLVGRGATRQQASLPSQVWAWQSVWPLLKAPTSRLTPAMQSQMLN